MSFVLDPICNSRSRPWAGVPSAIFAHPISRTQDVIDDELEQLHQDTLQKGKLKLKRESLIWSKLEQNPEITYPPSPPLSKSLVPQSRLPQTPPNLETRLPQDLKLRFREGQRLEAQDELYEYGSNISCLDEDRRLGITRVPQFGDDEDQELLWFCFPRPDYNFAIPQLRIANQICNPNESLNGKSKMKLEKGRKRRGQRGNNKATKP